MAVTGYTVGRATGDKATNTTDVSKLGVMAFSRPRVTCKSQVLVEHLATVLGTDCRGRSRQTSGAATVVMEARNIRGLWPGTGVGDVGSGRFWAYVKVALSGSPAGEDWLGQKDLSPRVWPRPLEGRSCH